MQVEGFRSSPETVLAHIQFPIELGTLRFPSEDIVERARCSMSPDSLEGAPVGLLAVCPTAAHKLEDWDPESHRQHVEALGHGRDPVILFDYVVGVDVLEVSMTAKLKVEPACSAHVHFEEGLRAIDYRLYLLGAKLRPTHCGAISYQCRVHHIPVNVVMHINLHIGRIIFCLKANRNVPLCYE